MIKRFKFHLLFGFLLALSMMIYRAIHPPLPSWIQPPKGSSVLVSRRFVKFAYLTGPRYYCRIHSPLSARKTAEHFLSTSRNRGGKVAINSAPKSEYASFSGYMMESAYGKGAFSVDFKPAEAESWTGDESTSTALLVWPDAEGSTIEFFLSGRG